jgi:hypothetical protein
MLYTTYHKGQQQTGKFKDNIWFLSAAISDLLLDYLTWVIQGGCQIGNNRCMITLRHAVKASQSGSNKL